MIASKAIMDRCRCAEYAEAVNKLSFYTVGTHIPMKIDKFDRTGYVVAWRKHGVGYDDMKFSKPKAYKILPAHLHPDNLLPKECRKVEHMWCPFMTPVVIDVAEVTEPPKPIEPPKSGE